MPSVTMLPAKVSPPLELNLVVPKAPLVTPFTVTPGIPSHWVLNTLNASAWNWTVKRSLTLVFLNTPRLAVLIGCPRSVLRPTPRNGDPKNLAEIGSLMIQCAWFKARGLPVTRSIRPQLGALALVHWPTEVNGAAGLEMMGRQASREDPVQSVGSQSEGPAGLELPTRLSTTM